MKIIFSPQRRDEALTLHKTGDVLTINGEAYDFSALPDGATLPRAAIACTFIAGDVERINGILHIPLILPHGPNPSQAAAFPDPLIDPPDGELELPT
jgi:hypothetical protein